MSGLDKLGDDLAKRRREEAAAKKEAAKAKTIATKYLQNSSDQINTGNPLDLVHNAVDNEIQRQGVELADKGLDYNDIVMSLQPLAEKRSILKTNAKNYQAFQKFHADKLPLGYDKEKYIRAMNAQAFPVDESTGVADVTKFDPNKDYDYLTKVSGADIYDGKDLEKYLKDAKKEDVDGTDYKMNQDGGYNSWKLKISKPTFYQQETGKNGEHLGFVPKYELVDDEGQKLLHDFKGDGTKDKIRILPISNYNQLPEVTKQKIRNEVKQDIADLKMDVDIDSPQAKILMQGIAYNKLKDNANVATSYSYGEKNKSNPRYNFADKQAISFSYKKKFWDYQIRNPKATNTYVFNPQQDGNLLDKFNGVKDPIQDIYIENGVAKDGKGNLKTGEYNFPTTETPDMVRSTIAANSKDYNFGDSSKVYYLNGVAQAFQSKKGTKVDREDMKNYQSGQKGKLTTTKTRDEVKFNVNRQAPKANNAPASKLTSNGLPKL